MRTVEAASYGGGVAALDAVRPLLALEAVSVRFGRRAPLRDVSLTLKRGEALTVVGPNGGGKTTLLRLAIGELAPSQGEVTRAADLRIGYAPQKLAVDQSFPLTVARFVSLSGCERKAGAAAMEVAGAADLARLQLADLSGGELQRTLLARALAREPNLLVLDEPTQNLDQSGAAAFYRLLDAVRAERNIAVLMVSHELHVVMASSNHVLCLNGHICCQGAPADVSAHPEYQRLFGCDASTLAPYHHSHDHSHAHGWPEPAASSSLP